MAQGAPVLTLFLLAMVIACIAWTVTHEEVFREPREFCKKRSEQSLGFFKRKFFYVFTCEYCFSHYVTAAILVITKYRLLYDNWRGYLIAGFALVWIANIYMSIFAFIRIDLKKERAEAEKEEKENNKISRKNA
ncbi:MAG TPA: hypothetical protein VG738_22730 [Chitinophagaceae bacterium]|nr:hypothetical protein [Chitinophagaceae bacterium]